jgi:hypothetical protein
MATMCRQRAVENPERRGEWLAQAELWNQLAGAAIGHPFKEMIEVGSIERVNKAKTQ